MKLPKGARAIVEIEKLADILHQALVRAAREQVAMLGFADEYGQRYVIDFDMNGPFGRATVRSSRIVRSGENVARLTSSYVL